jgi:hypothetical protein
MNFHKEFFPPFMLRLEFMRPSLNMNLVDNL